jgi:hypothetical protein
MSKRSIRHESSHNAAHKRQAAAPQDDGLLPSESASASLAQQALSLSIPKTPLDLIADLILPLVPDRETWNSVHSASKHLRRAGKKMTPPWPNKVFNVGRHASVFDIAFSPSGSQLAFCVNNNSNTSFMFGIDGARKPSSGVTPALHVAWNARWMGSIWRQEAKMDRFESGVQNRFTPLLRRLTGKDPHGHQNKPKKLF